MDTTSVHPFSTHVPFKQPIVITHYLSMVIAFLGCYPLLLTQHIRRQKAYIFTASIVFASVGFISGSFIQLEQNATTIVFHVVALLLLCLVVMQGILAVYRSTLIAEQCPQLHTLLTKCLHTVPKWVDLVLGWLILIIAFSYLTLAALVFTESCGHQDQQAQCLMPLAMGTGFLLYGTLILLHLLAIIKLPRPSTPEYYEGIIMTVWGCISLVLADTPILGTEWRAINLGLLWFTGGLFSISLSVQTWIPALRERNIINALIVCFTGRAIVAGLTQVDDPYAAQVHTMLGYVLIVGAIARLTQIVFRKSPADNLPHRMFQQNTDTTNMLEEEEEEEKDAKSPKCKHKFIFVSITLVTGLLAALLAICSGILLMGANIGWIRYMRFYIQDPATYVNITCAVAFLWSAYVFGLCSIYKNLKTRNAIREYEYLELENTTDYNRYPEHDEPWMHVPISPTTTLSPTMSPIIIPSHDLPTKPDAEKTIRPSQYRAKRRSLLVQTPTTTPVTRTRSSSMYGVGGVLPDEYAVKPTVDPSFRRSWRSSTSSTLGSASMDSGPNSPSFTEQQQLKAFSISSQEEDNYPSDHTEHQRSVHKTESGKRKERRLISTNSDDHDAKNEIVSSNSSGTNRGRYQYQRNSSLGQAKK
ncbi:uncharacterized protein B0P05DRAFT_589286 [Gilbertella persicaria]|uniref:Protein YTP1-like C-terminal domain-containing protein n=1 Tax=Rhizopus stolonifer TaxID=4846 RepID=A0A367JB59_RHIST|nr:uncharacterized protein B0P05DRAFT_589286 [Gilbertella persicaria]KAI8069823.1 hypothetical protein B0P05DRAFT_589286 [Gilbertella persicaria]RCH87174.1 hypothetical protein CU098_004931 [Rhizopus stolonifer]